MFWQIENKSQEVTYYRFYIRYKLCQCIIYSFISISQIFGRADNNLLFSFHGHTVGSAVFEYSCHFDRQVQQKVEKGIGLTMC